MGPGTRSIWGSEWVGVGGSTGGGPTGRGGGGGDGIRTGATGLVKGSTGGAGVEATGVFRKGFVKRLDCGDLRVLNTPPGLRRS